MKSIAVVTSALNEAEVLPLFFEEVVAVITKFPTYQWRIIVCDNGSTDSTWSLLKEYQTKYPWLTIFRMGRTLTFDSALTAGLDMVTEDAVITMASDLQDSPAVIPELIRKWESGNEIVAVRIKKRHGVRIWVKIFTVIYYRLASWLSDGALQPNVSDFRLMSQKAYSVVRNMREQHRFMRGLVAQSGFKPSFIDLDRPARMKGSSKTKFFPVFNLAFRGILANSNKPISIMASLSLLIFGLVIIGSFLGAINWVVQGVPFEGFGWIILLILLSWSFNMLFMSVIASYVGLIYVESKKRPLYSIAEVHGDKP